MFFLTPHIFYHSIKFHCFGELHVGISQKVLYLSYNNFILAESSWSHKWGQSIQLLIMFIEGYFMDQNIEIAKIRKKNFTFFFLCKWCQNSISIYSLGKTVNIFQSLICQNHLKYLKSWHGYEILWRNYILKKYFTIFKLNLAIFCMILGI